MPNQITQYLKYANLQMAAEALFGFAQNGVLGRKVSGPLIFENLKLGNKQASQFPPELAKDLGNYCSELREFRH